VSIGKREVLAYTSFARRTSTRQEDFQGINNSITRLSIP